MKIYVAYYWWGGSLNPPELVIGMICTDRAKVESFIRGVDESRPIKREWQIEELEDGDTWPIS